MSEKHITRLQCLSLRGLARVTHTDLPEPFHKDRDLPLASINVFAGPNGCGKTTILDAVRSLVEPELLGRLRRENIASDTVSGFQIQFANGACVRALFRQAGLADHGASSRVWEWQHTHLSVRFKRGLDFRVLTLATDLPVLAPVEESHLQYINPLLSALDVRVFAWPQVGRSAPDLKDYLSVLPRFQHLFPVNQRRDVDRAVEFAAIPGGLTDVDGVLHQHHGDDLVQSSRVMPEYLPSGWQQIADLVSWVERCSSGSVCLIDEPERHLHPLLQRALIAELSRLSRERNLQFLIATHSPSFLNRRVWGQNVQVFHMQKGHATVEPDASVLLDQLGCVASDLCQSNGIVWVEGPSDRIYLNAFLRSWYALYAPQMSPGLENVHFSYAFFDGSCLVHFSGAPNVGSHTGNADYQISASDEYIEVDALIDVLSLNRNAAICMDLDTDFCVDDFGSLFAVNAYGRTKLRVTEELLTAKRGPVHVTTGYTMECYVASVMPKSFIYVEEGRVVVRGSKVQHALRFASKPDAVIAECLEQYPVLKQFVSKLADAINRWSG